MANIDLGGGLVVSDEQVKAAGFDPNAVREAIAFGSGSPGVPFGNAPTAAAGKLRIAISSAVKSRSICQKYEDAVKNNLPPRIQTSLRTMCNASKAAAVAQGAPDGEPSSGISPIVIVGGVAALAGAAWFLFLRK